VGKSLADSFDECLLSGPAPEKGFGFLSLWHFAKGSPLPRRKKPFADGVAIRHGTEEFQIHAHFPAVQESKKG